MMLDGTHERPGALARANKTITRKGAGRQVVSDRKHWGTPAKYVAAVRSVFGGDIDLDPCSNAHSLVNATVEYCSPRDDGLKKSWNHKRIYVNPPYGNDKENRTTIRHWLERCAGANDAYGSEVLALVPVAANTLHWKKYVFTRATAICFLYDTRLRFLEDGKDVGVGAPMACAMVYWGRDIKKFYDVFIDHGAVVDISTLIGEQIGLDRKHQRVRQTTMASLIAS